MRLTVYVSRNEEEIELASIEDSVDASIQRFEDYIEKSGGRLIAPTRYNNEHENQGKENN